MNKKVKKSRTGSALLVVLGLLFLFMAACSGPEEESGSSTAPTAAPMFNPDTPASDSEETAEGSSVPGATDSDASISLPSGTMGVVVDANSVVGTISPLVYGISGGSADYLEALRPTLRSWGGNPNSRYNWRLGNAWNAGSDWFFRNTDYGYDPEVNGLAAHDNFAEQSLEIGAEMRLAVPTVGWVAKDSSDSTCSFPLPNGECGEMEEIPHCRSRDEVADPELANVRSTPEDIQEWLAHMVQDQGYDVRFVAMDNEPELWGYTHYDVHPECTTYQEILDKYLTYATAVRQVAPDAELTGPVTCCWEFYFHSPAGSRDERQHDNMPFIPWFLEQVRRHDEETGERSLDVLDIHYYPEGIFNNDVDPETAAQRLRSTRSLWDPTYTDESWIRDRIRLIPRMNEWIETYYPGTRLGLSEWNWGADETMNGALAIADVLGILGREELYFAAYWRFPPLGSPGFYAFKMYTNYDDAGGRFEGTALSIQSENEAAITSYAALDEEGTLRVMLLNKLPDRDWPVSLFLQGVTVGDSADVYRYSEASAGEIVHETEPLNEGAVLIELPAYSITLLVLDTE